MSDFFQQEPLILASGSAIRQKLLASLGLEFQSIPSMCDEDKLKKNFTSKDWVQLGYLLASQKALAVSQQCPDHYVIGADQLCLLEDSLFDKPCDHKTAIQHLKRLQGKTHQQMACLSLVKNGKILWQHHEIASLTMRTLNDLNIDQYLHIEKPYQSCGAYQFETRGKWLFEKVTGAEDTVLGLPLNPLIKALLTHHVVMFP